MRELARRGDGEQQEHRLRAEPGRDHRSSKAVIRGVASAKQPHQPADGQADVQRRVGDVEPGDETPVRQHEPLELRLDVDSQPFLERDDPLGVAPGPLPAVTGERQLADEQIDRVEAEADRDLALPGEPFGAGPARHGQESPAFGGGTWG